MNLKSTQTLSAVLWPAHTNNTFLRNAVWAFIGTMVLAISAKVQVPFYPVPVTMQSFVVLLIGAGFGWRLGMATIALYLFEGLALGLPVFAGETAGIAYLLKPSMGYLFSYLVAAGVVGFMAERGFDRTPLKALLMMSIGAVLILSIGAGWAVYVIGVQKVWAFYVAPFLYGDAVKVALAAAILPATWKILGK